MNFNFTEINTTYLPIYLVIGAIIFIFFYITNTYIKPFLTTRKLLLKNWKKAEITVWLLYAVSLYIASFQAHALITLVATLVLIGLGFNFWQNIFSGIIIEFTNQFEIGEVIATDFVKGELKQINLLQLELVNDKGEVVIIPNRMIRNAILTHCHKKNNVQTHTFKVSKENSTIESIHTLAINCPYISVNQKIQIEQKSKNKFIINAAIIDASLVGKIDAYFRLN